MKFYIFKGIAIKKSEIGFEIQIDGEDCPYDSLNQAMERVTEILKSH